MLFGGRVFFERAKRGAGQIGARKYRFGDRILGKIFSDEIPGCLFDGNRVLSSNLRRTFSGKNIMICAREFIYLFLLLQAIYSV